MLPFLQALYILHDIVRNKPASGRNASQDLFFTTGNQGHIPQDRHSAGIFQKGVTMPTYFSEAWLDRIIEDDIPYGDLTTESLGIGSKPGKIVFSTREPTVICGTEEAARIFKKLGAQINRITASGTVLSPNADFFEAVGNARTLHAGWRVCLSLLEHVSGIATRTRKIVDLAQKVNPLISVETSRKSFPGGKKVTIKAVLCGGAHPHRLGLSESLLVFRHHQVFMESQESFWAALDRIRNEIPGKKLTLEVENEAEAMRAAQAGVDIIQLDKMPVETLKTVIDKVRKDYPAIKIAAAGGINEKNASEYAATGADILVLSSVFAGKTSDIGARIMPLA
ncbi:MAG: ModD protein [Syntrophotalea acetylenica]|nr:ModD protein [Syntrophotalea acetylenica]